VLAAQVKIVQREIAPDVTGIHRSLFSLFDVSPGAELCHWEAVPDQAQSRELLLRVLHTGRGSALVAAKALITHPDRMGTADAVEPVFDELPYESALVAVWAYLNLVGDDREKAEADRLGRSENEYVREAIATMVTSLEDGRPSQLAVRMVYDTCRQVRLAAIEQFKKHSATESSPELVELLHSIAQSEDSAFVCRRCGTQNVASSDSCSSCHIVTNRPSAEAAKLLKTIQPN